MRSYMARGRARDKSFEQRRRCRNRDASVRTDSKIREIRNIAVIMNMAIESFFSYRNNGKVLLKCDSLRMYLSVAISDRYIREMRISFTNERQPRSLLH